MTAERRNRLLELVKGRALLRGRFLLSSGAESSYYFDGKMAITWPEGNYLAAREIFDLVKDTEVVSIGGEGYGAALLASAVALLSHLEGRPVPAFFVRAEAKEHGTKKQIEGSFAPGSRVAIVDDVITTGGSIFRAIEAVEAQGSMVVKVVALLDRHQGGSEELKRRGYDFSALLSADASGKVTIERS